MLEVGNGDFQCGTDAASLARCRIHFSLWCITKAVLLIGSNVTAMSDATLGVYANGEAISLNQDALGIAGRRVAVYPPSNTTLTSPWDALAVLAPCTPHAPTQAWTWTNKSVPGPPTALNQAKCDGGDATQGWAFPGDGTLRHTSSGLCLSAPTGGCSQDAVRAAPCDPTQPSQQWRLQPGGQIQNGGGMSSCLDIPYGTGAAVSWCTCHPPGTATNQEWVWSNSSTRSGLTSLAEPGTCMTLAPAPSGGWLSTVDAEGETWCLGQGGEEGSWKGVQGCVGRPMLVQVTPWGGGGSSAGPRNYTLLSQEGDGVGWNNAAGASGPWPHTRYITGGNQPFTLDLSTPNTTILAVASGSVLNDDSVGGVTVGGGPFCLDLATSGGLEVWAVPLAGGKIGVGLWNRSPGPDSITAQWAKIGGVPGGKYAVRDVWEGVDVGVFQDSYTPATPIPPKSVTLLILTPQ
jgi:hypothetical protein